MTTNYHTEIPVGADADAATFNAPLGQLDLQIGINLDELVDARGTMGSLDARLDASLNENGTIKSGAITGQTMINIGDAAAVAGDAVRYNEYIIHTHPVSATYAYFAQIFGDRSVSAAADTPAAGLPTYIRTDNNDNLVTFILFPLYKRASMDYVILTGAKKNTCPILNGVITFGSGAATTTEAIAAGQVITAFEKGLDISALADDTYHEFRVQMNITGAIGGATGQLELSNVQVWGAPTAPAPS